MVCDLTGMAVANASMLDEATAAAEAMTLAKRSVRSKSDTIIVAGDCHPQTIDVVRTRAKPLGLKVLVGFAPRADAATRLLRGPRAVPVDQRADPRPEAVRRAGARQAGGVHRRGRPAGADAAQVARASSTPTSWSATRSASACRWAAAARTPPSWPAATSSSARCPAAWSAPASTAHGQPAYRLALQTREQHIRREKATSNICTAQVLLAVIASMYAVYHGPQGLKRIAQRVASATPRPGRWPGQRWGQERDHAACLRHHHASRSASAPRRSPQRARDAGANLRRLGRRRSSASRSTRPPRAPTSSALWSWLRRRPVRRCRVPGLTV